mgnify:CR=1 FL=1
MCMFYTTGSDDVISFCVQLIGLSLKLFVTFLGVWFTLYLYMVLEWSDIPHKQFCLCSNFMFWSWNSPLHLCNDSLWFWSLSLWLTDPSSRNATTKPLLARFTFTIALLQVSFPYLCSSIKVSSRKPTYDISPTYILLMKKMGLGQQKLYIRSMSAPSSDCLGP